MKYQIQMPFWIDTDGYTDRDREMFVCGVEFEMLRRELDQPLPVHRTIHTENESRAKLMSARLGRHCTIEPSGVQGWSYFSSE